jgi:EAL domain-containing protein (putative c-di-GMP-specific phosphodiesterase class I)
MLLVNHPRRLWKAGRNRQAKVLASAANTVADSVTPLLLLVTARSCSVATLYIPAHLNKIGEAYLQAAPQAWAEMFPAVLDDRSIRFCYQPIVRLSDRQVVAYEALARPQGIDLDLSVEGFFEVALQLGYGCDLDWLCGWLCLQTSRDVIDDGLLFMNIGVSSLLAPTQGVEQMTHLLDWAGWSASEVVLEITEREVVSDLQRFHDVLATYRALGFRFAMDDVGDGHSTLEVLAAGEPEFIKIARRLTSSAGLSGARAAVHAVAAFADSLGSEVIAEGIEDELEANLMGALGCHLGQGNALGRPAWPQASIAIEDAPCRPALKVLTS